MLAHACALSTWGCRRRIRGLRLALAHIEFITGIVSSRPASAMEWPCVFKKKKKKSYDRRNSILNKDTKAGTVKKFPQ